MGAARNAQSAVQAQKHKVRFLFRSVSFLGLFAYYCFTLYMAGEEELDMDVARAANRKLLAVSANADTNAGQVCDCEAIILNGEADEYVCSFEDASGNAKTKECDPGYVDAEINVCDPGVNYGNGEADAVISFDQYSDAAVGGGSCQCVAAIYEASTKSGEEGLVVAYVLGVMYMFLALAVVCDEYFVPALDQISEDLALSNDVAGATFMAAGGSAPELFTSFIGTFTYSDVGFGTIVGSALFNVLFVIGVCAMASKEILKLTWWPLFRDCIYYALSLGVLAAFMGGPWSVEEIEMWEALILFLMYGGYVLLMVKSQKLERWVKLNITKELVEDQTKEAGVAATTDAEAVRRENMKSFNSPMAFRTGIYKMFTSDRPMMETAGVAMVANITGDVNETFDRYDKDGSGSIDTNELRTMLAELLPDSTPPTEKDVQDAAAELDANNDGTISKEEFSLWYVGCENRLKGEMVHAFEKFDENSSGTIDKDELTHVLVHLGANPTEEEINTAMSSLDKSNNGQIESAEFYEWYQTSLFWKEAQANAEVQQDAAEGVNPFKPPEGAKAKLMWLVMLPLVVPMHFCIPDARQAKWRKFAVLGFFMSIVFIGIFSFLMVDWATRVGDTLRIPINLMGLTFLAAGTSVPDLLSSVIVAKQGHGDMAVSSSIGSNIFDVLIGLPFPWLAFTIVEGKNVIVGAAGLTESIMILMGMLVFLVALIAACGWKMSKTLGAFFFVLYFAFVGYSLAKPGALNACPAGFA